MISKYGKKLKAMGMFGMNKLNDEEFPISKERLKKVQGIDKFRDFRSCNISMESTLQSGHSRMNKSTTNVNRSYLQKTLTKIQPFIKEHTNCTFDEADQID